MEIQITEHYNINGRYKMQFEQSATKGVIGWKVEANGDSMDEVLKDAGFLKGAAERLSAPSVIEPAPAIEAEEK